MSQTLAPTEDILTPEVAVNPRSAWLSELLPSNFESLPIQQISLRRLLNDNSGYSRSDDLSYFDTAKTMSNSVLAHGIKDPLLIRVIGGESRNVSYQLLDGRARYFCAKAASLKTVPAVVVEMTEVNADKYSARNIEEKRVQRVFNVGISEERSSLASIAWMIEDKQRPILCFVGDVEHKDNDELDNIADDIEMIDDSLLSDRDHYFHEVLPCLSWWKSIAEMLLGSRDFDKSLKTEPSFEEHRKTIIKLFTEAICAFPAAWAAGEPYVSDDWLADTEPMRVLLKHYRFFTRYVTAFAQELYPDVDMTLLRMIA